LRLRALADFSAIRCIWAFIAHSTRLARSWAVSLPSRRPPAQTSRRSPPALAWWPCSGLRCSPTGYRRRFGPAGCAPMRWAPHHGLASPSAVAAVHIRAPGVVSHYVPQYFTRPSSNRDSRSTAYDRGTASTARMRTTGSPVVTDSIICAGSTSVVDSVRPAGSARPAPIDQLASARIAVATIGTTTSPGGFGHTV
jgi:hypothetical protein